MKWPKGKKKNGSSKKNKGVSSPSPSKSAGSPALATTPGLGTLRLGTLRPESAPICTPTPTSRRQLISDLLTDDEDDSSTVTASPALRSIISNKSSTGCVDSMRGTGDSFTSYTSEEKVRDTAVCLCVCAGSMTTRVEIFSKCWVCGIYNNNNTQQQSMTHDIVRPPPRRPQARNRSPTAMLVTWHQANEVVLRHRRCVRYLGGSCVCKELQAYRKSFSRRGTRGLEKFGDHTPRFSYLPRAAYR